VRPCIVYRNAAGIICTLIGIPVAAAVQLIVEEVVYPRMDLG